MTVVGAQVYGFCKSIDRPIPTNDIWISALSLESDATILDDDRHLLPKNFRLVSHYWIE